MGAEIGIIGNDGVRAGKGQNIDTGRFRGLRLAGNGSDRARHDELEAVGQQRVHDGMFAEGPDDHIGRLPGLGRVVEVLYDISAD